MKLLPFVLAFIGLVTPGGFSAAEVATAERAEAFATATPRPEYPQEAQRNHLTGRGVVRLQIDPSTGNVTRAEMERSTGHGILDKAALDAFRRWRFRRGSISNARLPISFGFNSPVYSFRGVVRWIQARRPGLRVQGPHVTVLVIIPRGTKIVKNGKPARFEEIRLLDHVEGQGSLHPPDFRVYAHRLTVTSPVRR